MESVFHQVSIIIIMSFDNAATHDARISRPVRHWAEEGDTLARLSEIQSNLPNRKITFNDSESDHSLKHDSSHASMDSIHDLQTSRNDDVSSFWDTPNKEQSFSYSENTNRNSVNTSTERDGESLDENENDHTSDEDYNLDDTETDSEDALIWDEEEDNHSPPKGLRVDPLTTPLSITSDILGLEDTLEAIVLDDESDTDSDIVQVYANKDTNKESSVLEDPLETPKNTRSRLTMHPHKTVIQKSNTLGENSSSSSTFQPPIPLSRQDCVKRGKWTLGSKIGAGSFGVVHVGMNHLTGTLMAVKCIHLSRDTDTMEDVQREMDLMKSLHHVNIVRYMGVEMDRDKGMLYIFQEWVPGGSVSSLLSKFGPFPIPVVRSYLHQIILGLQYLHSKHILHRDIKGGNVLVNDSGVVKLADFGASKMCAPESSFGMDEEPMTMRGTPYFMAVEVFEEKYGRKADIWSCAGVAFQMITAQPPWKDLGLKSPMSLYRHLKATEGPPPMDEKLSTSLGADIMNLLTTCFDRDASKRPSASDLLEHKFFLDVDKEEELSDSSPTPNRLLQSPPWISPKGQFYSNGIVEIQKNKENVSLLEYDTSEWPEWAKKGLLDP